jgi:hypothetical protein
MFSKIEENDKQTDTHGVNNYEYKNHIFIHFLRTFQLILLSDSWTKVRPSEIQSLGLGLTKTSLELFSIHVRAEVLTENAIDHARPLYN